MTHPDLAPARLAELRAALDTPDATGSGPPVPAPVGPGERAPAGPGTVRGRVRALRTRIGTRLRPAADRVLDRVAELVARRLARRSETPALAAELALLRAELAAAGADGTALLLTEARQAWARADALATSFELLKAELDVLRRMLDRLGEGLAPGSGLEAAPERLAELRDRLGTIERRVRDLGAPGVGTAGGARSTGGTETSAPHRARRRFDYLGFERRFRGSSVTVNATLIDRYGERLRDHQPVLDVGCGRGELVAALGASGVEATGVEIDPDMAAEAAAAGLPVTCGEARSHLRALPPGSLGAVIAVHVVEHLELEELVELLELAATRLRPGGILVAETPNPTSLVVLGNSYILDPTHVWPLHPLLLQFLCERAGFRDVTVEYHAPAEGYRLPPITTVPGVAPWIDEVNDRLARLNDVLFGPQEYAVVARTGPPTGPGAP